MSLESIAINSIILFILNLPFAIYLNRKYEISISKFLLITVTSLIIIIPLSHILTQELFDLYSRNRNIGTSSIRTSLGIVTPLIYRPGQVYLLFILRNLISILLLSIVQVIGIRLLKMKDFRRESLNPIILNCIIVSISIVMTFLIIISY